MTTFLILLIIVFVPFIGFIIRMLRYTDETVGTHSPLYVVRTYQVSARQYFGTFYKILLAVLFPMMLLSAYVCAKAAINQQPVGWVFVPCFLAFAGYVVFYFYVDWEYWQATRDVTVTMNPYQPSLTIDRPVQSSVLTPDNVVRIEYHLRKSSNSKEPFYDYGYFMFHQTNGQAVRVNTIFFELGQVEFIERFFKHVPQSIVWHRLPRIINDPHPESAEPPNFAAYHPR